MKYCYKRFVVTLLLPPMIGTSVWIAFITLETAPSEQSADFILIAPFIYLYAFVFCLIPGQAYFWIHELLLKRNVAPFERKSRFLTLGAILGTFCGLAIASAFGSESLYFFIPIGMAAGWITSWINLLVSQPEQARTPDLHKHEP